MNGADPKAATSTELSPDGGTVNEGSLRQDSTPFIPDHELLRRIGGGSYGEVWLARNVLGKFRAVKVVYRSSFDHDRPFEREYNGIRQFEPMSRLHDSQVDILHVGRNEQAGYFYYVMELADDASGEAQATAALTSTAPPGSAGPGSEHGPGQGEKEEARVGNGYVPKTLKHVLHERGRLPFAECLEIGLALTTALEVLHRHGLVHRDIKPSNIIFIGGVPKLADIGLVTRLDATLSLVGTPGYFPPEGAGSPQADLYSLGKVLYEVGMGRDRQDFPKLPADFEEPREREALLELNGVLCRACEGQPGRRYRSASQMQEDLARLRRGQSVRRRRVREQRLSAARKGGLVVLGVGLLTVGGWLLSTRHGSSHATQLLRAAPVELTSMALIPFTPQPKGNHSRHLSDTLATGMSAVLTNVAGLRVAALADVFRFRGQSNEAPAIGRQLGVQWTLEVVLCRERWDTNEIQVTAELTHLPDGAQPWSASYERTLDELGPIARDIISQVARVVSIPIDAPPVERLETSLGRKVEAYRIGIRADELISRQTREGFTEGVQLLHQALHLDPNYNRPHRLLAFAYWTASEWHLPPHQAMPEARFWALRALELEDYMAFSQSMLGIVKMYYEWDWDGAEQAFLRAIASVPNEAPPHSHYSQLLRARGHLPEARVQQELAARLEPGDLSYVVGLARLSILERNYDAAIEQCQRILADHPDYLPAQMSLGTACERRGLYPQAIAAYEAAQALENSPDIIGQIAHLHARRGDVDEARRLLAELERVGATRYVSPVYVARVWMRLGEQGKALDLLDKAGAERCSSLLWLKTDDVWDPVHDNLRFQAVLKKVGLAK